MNKNKKLTIKLSLISLLAISIPTIVSPIVVTTLQNKKNTTNSTNNSGIRLDKNEVEKINQEITSTLNTCSSKTKNELENLLANNINSALDSKSVKEVNVKLFKPEDATLDTYMVNANVVFDDGINLTDQIENISTDNNVLIFNQPFSSNITSNLANLYFELDTLVPMFNTLVKDIKKYYKVKSNDMNTATNNNLSKIISDLNAHLVDYVQVNNIESLGFSDEVFKNGYRTVDLKISFALSGGQNIQVEDNPYFRLNQNALFLKVPLETAIKTINKKPNGNWDFSGVWGAIKKAITSSVININSNNQIQYYMNEALGKVQAILSPYLSPKKAYVENNVFMFGPNGKQKFNFCIDLGWLTKVEPNYEKYGFSFWGGILTLNNVETSISNNSVDNVAKLDVSDHIDSIFQIAKETLGNVKSTTDSTSIHNALTNLKNRINSLFGSNVVRDVRIASEGWTSNVNYDIGAKLDIIFNNPVSISNSVQTDFVCEGNILKTGVIPTGNKANYQGINFLIKNDFNQLTLDDIKFDISESSHRKFNLIRDNLEAMQNVLIPVVAHFTPYRLFTERSVDLATLINTMFNVFISGECNINRLVQLFFEDKTLSQILNDPDASYELENLLGFFLPKYVSIIPTLINAIKKMPISQVISIIKKLVGSKLPADIVNSLDQLATDGLLTYLANNDAKLLQLMPQSPVKDLLVAILSNTSISELQNQPAITLLYRLLKENPSFRNALRALLNSFGSGSIMNLIDKIVYDNPRFTQDSLKDFLSFFAYPDDSTGRGIHYKDWFNSIRIVESFPDLYMSNGRLKLKYEFKAEFTSNIRFNVHKLLGVVPPFDLSFKLGDIKIGLNERNLPNNVSNYLSICKGDFVSYTLTIDDVINYDIRKVGDKNVLSWQANGKEQYNLHMPQTCKWWYKDTSGKAFVGVARVASRFLVNAFYHVIDRNLKYRPHKSILNECSVPYYNYEAKELGSIDLKELDWMSKKNLVNELNSNSKDSWIPNTEYKYGSSNLAEHVQISQYQTTNTINKTSIYNQVIQSLNLPAGVNYNFCVNVYSVLKNFNFIINLDSIYVFEVVLYLPYKIIDENGNFSDTYRFIFTNV